MSSLAKFLFKYRSYTPIPFLLLGIVYNEVSIWSLIAGFLVALSGELLRLWGVSYAGSETRTTGDVGGSFLVVSGPFAHVRNPLYVGNILLYTGIGIMSAAIFPYLQIITVCYFVFQYIYIIKEEEGYLRKTYGADFEEYCKNVNRFLPRLTAYKKEGLAQPVYDLNKGLRSERRSLQAFGLTTLTFLIIWLVRRF
jgi:protein-S-isoprenylcysteine O-methyltransferase Ste14